jgi:D-arabinan endo alpha-(1,5)-arabinofuranosidase
MTIGNTMYLHASAHFPFGFVGFTEIWKSVDEGRSWQMYGPRWDAGLHGGLAQLWTWAPGDDGFVYIMSTGFRRERNQPIILRRVPADRLGEPGAYQGWGFGPGGWAWGNELHARAGRWIRRVVPATH